MGGDIIMKDTLEQLKEHDPQIESVKRVCSGGGVQIAACVSDSSTVVQCTQNKQHSIKLINIHKHKLQKCTNLLNKYLLYK